MKKINKKISLKIPPFYWAFSDVDYRSKLNTDEYNYLKSFEASIYNAYFKPVQGFQNVFHSNREQFLTNYFKSLVSDSEAFKEFSEQFLDQSSWWKQKDFEDVEEFALYYIYSSYNAQKSRMKKDVYFSCINNYEHDSFELRQEFESNISGKSTGNLEAEIDTSMYNCNYSREHSFTEFQRNLANAILEKTLPEFLNEELSYLAYEINNKRIVGLITEVYRLYNENKIPQFKLFFFFKMINNLIKESALNDTVLMIAKDIEKLYDNYLYKHNKKLKSLKNENE